MSDGGRWADRVAQVWTVTYTRGLPDEARGRRRVEVAADLHDHAAWAERSARQQIHVLGRVLWGIPADLSWRRAATASRERRLASGASMTLRSTSTVLFGIFALFDLWAGVGVIGGGYWPWGLPLIAAGAAIVFALVTRDDAPRRATAILVVAALVPAATLYWMAVIFLPIGVAAIVLALASEPRSPGPAVT